MELTIKIEQDGDKAKKVFALLNELGIPYQVGKLSAKDAAFGIGRKASDAELDEYLRRCMEGDLKNIDDL